MRKRNGENVLRDAQPQRGRRAADGIAIEHIHPCAMAAIV